MSRTTIERCTCDRCGNLIPPDNDTLNIERQNISLKGSSFNFAIQHYAWDIDWKDLCEDCKLLVSKVILDIIPPLNPAPVPDEMTWPTKPARK